MLTDALKHSSNIQESLASAFVAAFGSAEAEHEEEGDLLWQRWSPIARTKENCCFVIEFSVKTIQKMEITAYYN